jgi:hypothetical protein
MGQGDKVSNMSRVPCAFSCDEKFLKLIDERAASLGMKRSQYIVQVLRQELLTGAPNLNIVAEAHPGFGKQAGSPPPQPACLTEKTPYKNTRRRNAKKRPSL